MLNKPSVENLLSQIIEFIAIDSSLDSNRIISFFTNDSIEHFGEPPNTFNKYSKYRFCGKRSSQQILKATSLSF
jgi:hypothetical protein